ncbi:hypothetical protein AKJ53_00185 [candidate division MSBL1 archaeon SCGC-AAA382F02]|uniref:Bacterial Ig-like domain-containing protein n=1 Tax=candidate division MSBL1 archaeon SCGC-AAA382F02 TaxID=1698282 RepID=A0A133VJ62_9EURY|nr:hypothetical protein AKJ53_00185 [candidate division MSBL1 archaeon SCGC-AAA382F02]
MKNAADALHASMGGEDKLVFGSRYLGYNADSADNLLHSAGENLASKDNFDINTAASNIESMKGKLNSAADKLSSAASNLAPSNWALDYDSPDGVSRPGRVEFIAENNDYQIGDGETKTFKFYWKSPSPGETKSYTLDVYAYENEDVGGTQLGTNTVSISVDDANPGWSTKKVTQSGIPIDNVVGNTYDNGKATITIEASEKLENLNTAWIENASDDNVSSGIGMNDWTTTDDTTFTYEFDVDETFANDNDYQMQIRVEKPWATDTYQNENNNELKIQFYVDRGKPILVDNGLAPNRLVASMRKKSQAGSGNVYWTDNESKENITGNVNDNWKSARFGYDNYDNDVVSVEIDWDGTVQSADKMDTPVNGFTQTRDLDDGIYSIIKVTATDWAGNSTTENIENILIDTTKPGVSYDTIAGDSWTDNEQLVTDNTPTISLTISDDGLGVARENLRVQLDNDDNFKNGTRFFRLENAPGAYNWDATAGEATFENTIDNINNNYSGLQDGLYYVTVAASDNYIRDGENSAYFAQSFKVDATAPDADDTYINRSSVTIQESDGTAIVSTGGATATGTTDESSLTLRGTCIEDGSTLTVYAGEDGTEVGSTTETKNDGDLDWEMEITGLSEGTTELYLEETDEAGNASDQVLFATITVDQTPPTISLGSDTQALDESSTDKTSITLSATITDSVSDYKDISVSVRADAYDRPETGVTIDSTDTLTIGVPLQKGSNTIDIVASDSVGNTTVKSITVERTVTPWTMYAAIAAIIAIILAAIAVLRRS